MLEQLEISIKSKKKKAIKPEQQNGIELQGVRHSKKFKAVSDATTILWLNTDMIEM